MDDLSLRLICSFVCGYLLTQAGSLVQASTQNELASPSTLGLSGVAALCAMIAGFFELPAWQGFLGSLILLIPLLFLLKLFFNRVIKGQQLRNMLIMLGLGINLLIGTIFSIYQFLSISLNIPFPGQLWYGHFAFVGESLAFASIGMLILITMLTRGVSKELNLLAFGDNFSSGLSIDNEKIVQRTFILAYIGTSFSVQFFGFFAFVGLVFPIIIRQISPFRFNFKSELAFGPLIGGFIFLVLDFICYQFPIMGIEIPVGMVTALVGSSLLTVQLLKKMRRNADS